MLRTLEKRRAVFEKKRESGKLGAMGEKRRKNDFGFKVVPTNWTMKPQNVPKTLYNKTSQAPAVVLPGMGLSMNPGKAAYENTLNEAFADELETKEAEDASLKKLAPVTTKLLCAFTKEELMSMSEGEKIAEYKRLMHEESLLGTVGRGVVKGHHGTERGTADILRDDGEFAFTGSQGVGLAAAAGGDDEGDISEEEQDGADNKRKLKPGERLTQADRNKKRRREDEEKVSYCYIVGALLAPR